MSWHMNVVKFGKEYSSYGREEDQLSSSQQCGFDGWEDMTTSNDTCLEDCMYTFPNPWWTRLDWVSDKPVIVKDMGSGQRQDGVQRGCSITAAKLNMETGVVSGAPSGISLAASWIGRNSLWLPFPNETDPLMFTHVHLCPLLSAPIHICPL